MTRRFRADVPVPESVLAGLLDLAGRAPSAGFSQGWDYVVLHTPQHREAFWAAATPAEAPANGRWLAGVRAAPVLILAYADAAAYRARYAEPDKARATGGAQDWPVPYWLTDTAMGVMILLLGARDAGLGALFFGVPAAGQEPVRAAFDVPPGRHLVGVIALGTEERRVGGSARRRPRREVADFTHWGAFGVPRPGSAAPVSDNADQTGPAADGEASRQTGAPPSGPLSKERVDRS